MNFFPPNCVDETSNDAKETDELTKYDELAVLGRPKLGDNTKACLKIKESKEFKVKHKSLLQLQIIFLTTKLIFCNEIPII